MKPEHREKLVAALRELLIAASKSLLAAFVVAMLWVALFLPGCASGPQVVPVTPVTNLTVNVYAYDGGAIRFGELWIDGTSADGQAEAQGVDVDAETDVSVETEVGLAP